MNETEHLLTILSEECAEVAKECSKALRFGLHDKLTIDPDGPRGTEGPTNAEKIEHEFVQLLAVYQKLAERGAVNGVGLNQLPSSTFSRMVAKMAKVERFMGYAEKVGALQRKEGDSE